MNPSNTERSQGITDERLGRSIRLSAGVGMVAIGGIAAGLEIATGAVSKHATEVFNIGATHSFLFEAAKRTFFSLPGVSTAMTGRKLLLPKQT